MAGLLDLFTSSDPAQQQGLLASAAAILNASGPSLMPHSLGQVLGAGYNGYQQGVANQQDQALRAMKMQAMQGELADQAQARKDALDARNFYLRYNQPNQQPNPTAVAQSVLGNDLSPTVANAAKLDAALPSAGTPQTNQTLDLYNRKMQQAQAMRASAQGNPVLLQQADALEKSALAFRPKYSPTFAVARGTDGKMHNYQLSEDGSPPLDTGLGVKPDLKTVDRGGSVDLYDANSAAPGTSFAKTMTFADKNAAARLAFDKSQAAENQDAPLDPLAVHLVAQQYLAGDKSALQNYGRGSQGAQNLNLIRSEIAKQAVAAGMSGGDIAAKIAEFEGMKSGQRTAGTRNANIEIAANEASQLAPLALQASQDVTRSGFLPFGKAQIMFDSNTNDPALRKFAMANQALVTAYAQAISRGGAATVSDKQHAEELLSTAQDQPSYAAAVGQMMKEIDAARAAPKNVRKQLSADVSGSDSGQQATQAQKFNMLPPAAQYDGKRMQADNGTVYRSVGGNWVQE
jgi:hypothetical protein